MRPRSVESTPSQKQLEVYSYIVEHVEIHGFQPSQAEIARHFGVTKNAIQMRLKELSEKGWLELSSGEKSKERAIKLRKVRFRAFYEGDVPPAADE